ncbi:MAG: hypothetical protein Q8K38_12720 [Burkholderiaceae bacterium]|nr:hypothetical protein [Burkholderiaceae bacterium]
MTPQQFIAQWGPGGPGYALNERQGAQTHFMDLCALLGVPTPGSTGDYLFEQDTLVLGEARGYADVFKRNHFAWENKAPGKNLDAALKQLLGYSLALANPPLLVVCDRLTLRIHTQFNGHPSETHTVLLHELAQPEKQALLRRLWTDPESFRPQKTSRDITEAAAKSFATLAEGLRKRGADPDEVAHFLTQCLFCFFAEDVGLLPDRMFEGLVNNRRLTSDKLATGLANLFTAMRDGGLYGNDDIPWFNGGLFKKIQVPPLTILDMTELRNAAALNWSAIDVSIFGTLFERGLDPAKRSQLGAHYTDPATILRIIEPVLSRPLLHKWERTREEIRGLMAKSVRKTDKHHKTAQTCFVRWLQDLRDYRVLDPACGSGNFLFLGLKALKDVEHQSHLDAAALGLDREADLVTGPHNVLGIELNEYAAELARVTVWIGELQWRMAHGYDFKTNPVLEPLDHIECRDALLSFAMPQFVRPEPQPVRPEPPVLSTVEGVEGSAHTTVRPEPVEGPATSGAQAAQTPGAHTLRFLKSPPTSAPPAPLPALNEAATAPPAPPTEAPWPRASVVIGNPPFLGDKKMRAELGDAYTSALRKVYEGRVPGGADLVCYWFEKARTAIETQGLGAAGLVATNSIRGGKNRKVLDAIAKTTRIYEAWSDEGWVNDGAAVRVSLVAFGHATQPAVLDGQGVNAIHADLTAGADHGSALDLTVARQLDANKRTCFVDTSKKASFDIAGEVARAWLKQPNPHGLTNALVVKPWINGSDLVKTRSDTWIVDFGVTCAETEASLFEAPFDYVRRVVKPEKDTVRNESERRKWWLHARAAPDMRGALNEIPRFAATSIVAKHRIWVWRPVSVLASHAVCVTARADDTTFGILHSRFHELWSLRMGTSLEDRPRYTPTTCFETFPFPAGLTPADTAHQRTETLEGGAVIPAGISESNQPLSPVESGPSATNNAASRTPERTNPEGGRVAKGSAQVKEELAARAGDTEQKPLPPGHPEHAHTAASLRNSAAAIAQAAKRLNDLREAWLNPPEWTERVPEVVPLGMAVSPYPDRIVARPGHEKDLAGRTLTQLYNARPAPPGSPPPTRRWTPPWPPPTAGATAPPTRPTTRSSGGCWR